MTRDIKVKLGASHPLGEVVTVNMTGPPTAVPHNAAVLQKRSSQRRRLQSRTVLFRRRTPTLIRKLSPVKTFTSSATSTTVPPLGMPESFTLKELKDVTAKVCNGEKSWDVFSAWKARLRN
jgi:guanosine-diphosphatase